MWRGEPLIGAIVGFNDIDNQLVNPPMTEIVNAVFDTASTADAAVRDLEAAHIPSTVVKLVSSRTRQRADSASGWFRSMNSWQRPLVTVAVADVYALAVVGILRQYGPVRIEERAA